MAPATVYQESRIGIIDMVCMSIDIKMLEKIVLDMVDQLMAEATNNSQRMVYSLFKASVLSKYLGIADAELSQGYLEKDVLDKAADGCYEQTCCYIRSTKSISDDAKNEQCKKLKEEMPRIMSLAASILKRNGIVIV